MVQKIQLQVWAQLTTDVHIKHLCIIIQRTRHAPNWQRKCGKYTFGFNKYNVSLQTLWAKHIMIHIACILKTISQRIIILQPTLFAVDACITDDLLPVVLQACCWPWSPTSAPLAACISDIGLIGTSKPWHSHCTCTAQPNEVIHVSWLSWTTLVFFAHNHWMICS